MSSRLTNFFNNPAGFHSFWLRTALANLVLAAVIGTVMRYHFVSPFDGFNFKHVLHAHSHTALLGWVHLGIILLFHRLFIPLFRQFKTSYHLIFGLSQLAVIGCFVFFPFYGYNWLTISFTTLHVILTYWFVVRFFRDTRGDTSTPVKWARISLLWIVFATLSVWLLPVITVVYGRSTQPYLAAVQFYLHFQFNGWHLFAFITLFIAWLERSGLRLPVFENRRFLFLLIISVFFAFAYNLYWIYGSDELYYLFAPAAVLHLTLIGYLFFSVRTALNAPLRSLSRPMRVLVLTAIYSLLIRSVMQAFIAIPDIAHIAINTREFFVGFLHILFLGVMSTGILFFAYQNRIVLNERSRLVAAGTALFIFGYAATEVLLNTQGIYFWQEIGFLPLYYPLIFIASLPLLAGSLMWLSGVQSQAR